MNDEPLIFIDYNGRKIRLTSERQNHILEHPEMLEQLNKIRETISSPEIVIATDADKTVHVYHRYYNTTPVTSKFLLVVVKMLDDDAFILTAFFSNRSKKGSILWQA